MTTAREPSIYFEEREALKLVPYIFFGVAVGCFFTFTSLHDEMKQKLTKYKIAKSQQRWCSFTSKKVRGENGIKFAMFYNLSGSLYLL